jgi:putative DNA primase/helicase
LSPETDTGSAKKPEAETPPEQPTEAMELPRANRGSSGIYSHWVNEPWSEPVDTDYLLRALSAEFKRYMVLPPNIPDVLSLWVLHAWTLDAYDISPYLIVVSPVRGCGKSTLLTLLKWLTPKSIASSNITSSAIYRIVEKHEPTLLLDEAETWAKGDDAMRGILNSGHLRSSAFVIRTVGEGTKMEPQVFKTWCPKVVACIGRMADTLESRGFVITLQRKGQGDAVERQPLRDTQKFATLRCKCLRWAVDNINEVLDAQPEIPEELYNRVSDNWWPLFCIADLAGGKWPKHGRDVALSIVRDADEGDLKLQLLKDIKRVFDENPHSDWFGGQVLADKLADLGDDVPWGEMPMSKRPITFRELGRMLKQFGIKARKTAQCNRYERTMFEKAWSIYK